MQAREQQVSRLGFRFGPPCDDSRVSQTKN